MGGSGEAPRWAHNPETPVRFGTAPLNGLTSGHPAARVSTKQIEQAEVDRLSFMRKITRSTHLVCSSNYTKIVEPSGSLFGEDENPPNRRKTAPRCLIPRLRI